MLPDKEIKKEFRKTAWANPEKYYAINVLKNEGFERHICKKCSTPFWTVNANQDVCGDPSCSGGFKFIGDSPVKQEMDYIQTWKKFSKLFKEYGYEPIKRYPVVARWRSDVDFVQASIYDFQPYVVSGEVQPPAKQLVVPQFSLRFNDIDNVGITGAHYTGFVMIGQHAFMKPDEWDQEKYFTDIYNWLRVGLGLPKNEITFHEDAWAGGGNFGPCMEFFSRGLELGNQVYMMYEQTPTGNKELNLKVLDMGMGHERNTWFTKGTSTSYESTFPTVIKMLYDITGIKIDKGLMKKFLPYSSFLNIDEVENINKVWLDISKKINVDVDELKTKVTEMAALYSIAEHLRTLLVAISDGALPSNVGGGYNLRIIFRRALSLADKQGWEIPIHDICEEHARYLKPIFPELSENLDNVRKILDIEKEKYEATKIKSKKIVESLLKKKQEIKEQRLIELYDSQGISPELIKEEAKKLKQNVEIPDDFYAKVSERHEQKKEVKEKESDLDLDDVKETEKLYFEDYKFLEFKAIVLKIIDKFVILDKTAFYPTSGGQAHDIGELATDKVVNVFKQGSYVVHEMEHEPQFKVGMEVEGHIDEERRHQLSQHHTATHIINTAAKRILGNHINQAGAKKEVDKAHLDITHYQSLSEKEEKAIEDEANKIVDKKIKINSFFLTRNEAEKKYGMEIYQGGAVPGKMIRIIEVPGVDVEACGGTHLKNTKETGKIKILKTTKIQDGIVRITFVAGKVAHKESNKEEEILKEVAGILGVKPEQVPIRSEELFKKWKEAKKAIKKGQELAKELLELTTTKEERATAKELLNKTAQIFKTQTEHVVKTAKRFLKELEEIKEKL